MFHSLEVTLEITMPQMTSPHVVLLKLGPDGVGGEVWHQMKKWALATVFRTVSTHEKLVWHEVFCYISTFQEWIFLEVVPYPSLLQQNVVSHKRQIDATGCTLASPSVISYWGMVLLTGLGDLTGKCTHKGPVAPPLEFNDSKNWTVTKP